MDHVLSTATAKLSARCELEPTKLVTSTAGGTPISTLGKICVLLDITQRVVVISYRRFGTTYRPHLDLLVPVLSLEDGTGRLSRKSVRNYYYMLRNSTENERSSDLVLGRSLKSRVG
jgi:hypothetical protein